MVMAAEAAAIDGGVQFNMSPLRLHGWAERYLQGYRELVQSSHDLSAPYLLLCRVIELELKAWHSQTTKRHVLKDIHRHDLMASYRALPAKHRILSSDEVGLLTRASEIFAQQEFERIGAPRASEGFKMRLNLARLETLAERIMEHGDGLGLGLG